MSPDGKSCIASEPLEQPRNYEAILTGLLIAFLVGLIALVGVVRLQGSSVRRSRREQVAADSDT